MKSILILLVTLSSFSAHALESYYGRVTRHGNRFTCTYHNNTNRTLDMKYVVFSIDRLGGGGGLQSQVRERVDQFVRTEEDISHSTRILRVHIAYWCKFQAR